MGLLSRRLLYVSGKGGVGKSTVAAALGLAALRRGRRTIVAEVHRRTDVEHAVTSRGVDHLSIDPEDAMEEYLADQLPVRALADLLSSSRAFTYLAAARSGLLCPVFTLAAAPPNRNLNRNPELAGRIKITIKITIKISK